MASKRRHRTSNQPRNSRKVHKIHKDKHDAKAKAARQEREVEDARLAAKYGSSNRPNAVDDTLEDEEAS